MTQLLLYTWDKAEELVLPIRIEVFVKEQSVPIDLEVDEYDFVAQHVVLFHDGIPIGTGRVFKKNTHEDVFYIGRLCVQKKYREMGFGQKIMNELLNYAQKNGAKVCYLHAQTASQFFYKKIGFKSSKESFMEAGIEHVLMTLTMT